MKIIFMGTPDFSVPTLQELIDSDNEVVAVFSAPPRPKNRGMKLTPSPVHELAEKHNIPVHNPTSLRRDETYNIIQDIEADIIIVVAYGFIVPKNILEAKKYGCLNLHPSSLPRWRGAAPLQRTIIAGDKSTSVCIMQMDEGLDTGDVLLRKDFDLEDRITLSELHDKCAEIGAKMMVEVLDNIDNITPEKQTEDGLIYAEKLSKEESKIDWNNSAHSIDCQIRGMNPWPGVHFTHNGHYIKILESEYSNAEHNKEPGIILDANLSIACGKGILKALRLQLPGKSTLNAEEFLKGYKIESGEELI